MSRKMEMCWQRVSSRLRRKLGDTAFEYWVGNAALISGAAPRVVLAVPTNFKRNWIATRYGNLLLTLWQAEAPEVEQVELVVGKARDLRDTPARPAPGITVRPAECDPLTGLDTQLSFETLYIGDANRFACEAARSMATGSETGFTPLYVFGEVGHGKSHLLHAAGLHFHARHPDRQVRLLNSEKFMDQFVSALQNRTASQFKNEIRSVDMLLLDDVHFIQGSGAVSKEFFHTLNTLLGKRIPVIITGTCPPADIKFLDESARSRLNGGVVAEVSNPDHDMRVGILHSRAERAEARIPSNVLDDLARSFPTDVRRMIGALNSIIARQKIMGEEITRETGKKIIDKSLSSQTKQNTVNEIKQRTADYYKVNIADMESRRRTRPVLTARHVAMYLSKQLTRSSLPGIGREFNRDHTTVLKAVRRVEKLRQEDTGIARDIEELQRRLGP